MFALAVVLSQKFSTWILVLVSLQFMRQRRRTVGPSNRGPSTLRLDPMTAMTSRTAGTSPNSRTSERTSRIRSLLCTLGLVLILEVFCWAILAAVYVIMSHTSYERRGAALNLNGYVVALVRSALGLFVYLAKNPYFRKALVETFCP